MLSLVEWMAIVPLDSVSMTGLPEHPITNIETYFSRTTEYSMYVLIGVSLTVSKHEYNIMLVVYRQGCIILKRRAGC